jgi:hypothetical protein
MQGSDQSYVRGFPEVQSALVLAVAFETGLHELNSLFAVSVASFRIPENHRSLMLRIEPETAGTWSLIEVPLHLLMLYPHRLNREKITATQDDVERLAAIGGARIDNPSRRPCFGIWIKLCVSWNPSGLRRLFYCVRCNSNREKRGSDD